MPCSALPQWGSGSAQPPWRPSGRVRSVWPIWGH
ncbi:Diguanylate phosphodiesterase [Streptomyces luteoverticillatus]|uniref:Diguanylate phosphodiesterase n=1 Tax=Streptomyces luteoverticillatus TaxID=66425 RepID=A0A3Q9FXX8_STRLT|nr:Diguanylate phosphodiesterase [Streptomyces luteoverticillatus]